MNLAVERVDGRVPVAVLVLEGELDASNFQRVIDDTRDLYEAGDRRLILDLRGVSYMGSSGLVALHSIAMIFRGQEPPDPELGWATFRGIGDDLAASGLQQAVKLLGPQPAVVQVLERTGMRRFFEVHEDRDAAVASF